MKIDKIESEFDLINRIKENDSNSFNKFFKMNYNEIYGFIYRSIYDFETAKDLAQDTFVKFWEARERLDSSSNPKAYLFKIARNLMINYSQRTTQYLTIDENESDSSLSIEDKMDYDNFEKDFQNGLAQLPEQCRVIFILSRYHNLKHEEIAEMLGISIQTVKNQMTKSLSILRKVLQEHLKK